MATPSLIELLEPRIAPATFVNAFVVTYTDVDGDLVKVKSSKPIFHDDLREFTFTPGSEGEELSELLLKPSASGADLKVKVIETGTSGDGAVNVRLIHATGVDLRSVSIEGALERISVGDYDRAVRGIGLLHVASLGRPEGEPDEIYLFSGAGIVLIDGDLVGSMVTPGDIDRLAVGGNLTGSVSAQAIGKIKIMGDLGGGEYDWSGVIFATSIRKITVEGSVIGGSSDYSGSVNTDKGIDQVVVKGDIVGGQEYMTGGFSYGGMRNASFWLGGSLIGGSGVNSGYILAKQIDLLRIDGDISGGAGNQSGLIRANNNEDTALFRAVRIGGNVQGGHGYWSGVIAAEVRTSLVVDGSILGGTGSHSGWIQMSAASDLARTSRCKLVTT